MHLKLHQFVIFHLKKIIIPETYEITGEGTVKECVIGIPSLQSSLTSPSSVSYTEFRGNIPD